MYFLSEFVRTFCSSFGRFNQNLPTRYRSAIWITLVGCSLSWLVVDGIEENSLFNSMAITNRFKFSTLIRSACVSRKLDLCLFGGTSVLAREPWTKWAYSNELGYRSNGKTRNGGRCLKISNEFFFEDWLRVLRCSFSRFELFNIFSNLKVLNEEEVSFPLHWIGFQFNWLGWFIRKLSTGKFLVILPSLTFGTAHGRPKRFWIEAKPMRLKKGQTDKKRKFIKRPVWTSRQPRRTSENIKNR